MSSYNIISLTNNTITLSRIDNHQDSSSTEDEIETKDKSVEEEVTTGDLENIFEADERNLIAPQKCYISQTNEEDIQMITEENKVEKVGEYVKDPVVVKTVKKKETEKKKTKKKSTKSQETKKHKAKAKNSPNKNKKMKNHKAKKKPVGKDTA